MNAISFSGTASPILINPRSTFRLIISLRMDPSWLTRELSSSSGHTRHSSSNTSTPTTSTRQRVLAMTVAMRRVRVSIACSPMMEPGRKVTSSTPSTPTAAHEPSMTRRRSCDSSPLTHSRSPTSYVREVWSGYMRRRALWMRSATLLVRSRAHSWKLWSISSTNVTSSGSMLLATTHSGRNMKEMKAICDFSRTTLDLSMNAAKGRPSLFSRVTW
mmetsp:Transcript_62751/g.136416  ORF Transcript_62751/g.136416 Transcript_62751/m.136416 type:complete len:216 (+) Transcript_62751:120-767(+)